MCVYGLSIRECDYHICCFLFVILWTSTSICTIETRPNPNHLFLEQSATVLPKLSGQLQRINELLTSYLGFQYPFLFPYGKDGYKHDALHRYTHTSQG